MFHSPACPAELRHAVGDRVLLDCGAIAPLHLRCAQASLRRCPHLGGMAERELKAGCACKWANGNSCAPRSNDDSRCWGVCCSGYSSDPPGV